MPKGATATRTLQVGAPAPDFALRSHQNQEIRLSGLRGQKVFIAFYPLAFTPV